jgi:mRNA-degrading endonuclease RelE of RelBE toxin-antitoxin system
VGKASPAPTPATSRPSLRIDFHERLIKQLRLLAKPDRKTVGQAIDQVCVSFGNPHLHAGIGLRKLDDALFECRSGLKTRLVFELLLDGSLYFYMMGSHDEVLKFLKARR